MSSENSKDNSLLKSSTINTAKKPQVEEYFKTEIVNEKISGEGESNLNCANIDSIPLITVNGQPTETSPSITPQTTHVQKEITFVDRQESFEIKTYLEIREEEKKKLSKRRESIRKKRESLETAQKDEKEAKIEITEIINMIKETEKETPLGKCKRAVKVIDVMLAIVTCANIVITLIDNELYISYSDNLLEKNNQTLSISVLKKMTDRKITSEENFLRFLNIGIVSTGVVLVILSYHFRIKLLKADKKLSKYDGIFSSGLYKYLFLELFLITIFYPPFMNNAIAGELLNLFYIYNFNAITSVFVIGKCYFIIRVYSYFSRWTSDSAASIGKKFNVNTGLHFAFKSELKKRPYTVLAIAVIVSMGICSFCVRVFEYSVFSPNTTSKRLKGDNELQDLTNCFWLIIITMLTVGYGDLSPSSHMGRAVVLVASILGMLLVSLIVVSLAVLTEFSDGEKKAYNVIKKLQADSNAYQKAANVIFDICKLRYLNEKRRNKLQISNSLGQRFIILTQLKKNISYFKNDFKIAASFSIPVDEMLKYLDFKMTSDLKELNTKLDTLKETEEKLEKIENIQETLCEKMDPILKRQEKIAKYIIELNNKNYITTIAKRRQQQRKEGSDVTKSPSRSKFAGDKVISKTPQIPMKFGNKLVVPINNTRKGSDILFTDHLN